MTTWTTPRAELIEIGVNLAKRGDYPVESIARNMVDLHFAGKNPKAIKELTRDIRAAWYAANGCQTEQQEQMSAMARQLRAEGWKHILDDEGRCMWIHLNSGITVNRNGGLFASFDEATQYTFNSATRQVFLEAK